MQMIMMVSAHDVILVLKINETDNRCFFIVIIGDKIPEQNEKENVSPQA